MPIKNHAIYGDDDQAKLSALFEQQEEIQRLVDCSNRQLMKERVKKYKNGKITDTTRNAVKVKEPPEDIKEGKPEKKSKPKKESKPKEQKQLNKSGIKKVGIIFIIIIILLLAFVYRQEAITLVKVGYENVSSIVNKVLNKNNSDEQNPVVESDEPNIDTGESGYLNPEELDNIKEVLGAADNANSALRNYYNSLIEIASASKTTSVVDQITDKAAMIEKDVKALESYEVAFSEYENGASYYNSLKNRFDHLQKLVSTLTYIEETKIYSYINQAINEENEFIIQGKNELVNFLKSNNIQYTVNDTSVTYELN